MGVEVSGVTVRFPDNILPLTLSTLHYACQQQWVDVVSFLANHGNRTLLDKHKDEIVKYVLILSYIELWALRAMAIISRAGSFPIE